MTDRLTIAEYRAQNRRKEDDVHNAVCQYIDHKYPGIMYTSDSSGVRLPIGYAVKLKRLRSKAMKIPDLIIMQPTKTYHGLIIEIKRDRDEVFTKKGQLRQDEHIQAQSESLAYLQSIGYKAEFGLGFDDCVHLIENYINFGR